MNAVDAVSWKLKALVAVAIFVLVAGAGAAGAWWLTKTNYEKDIASLTVAYATDRAQWQTDKAAISTEAQQATALAIQRMKDAQTALAKLDAETQRKLTDAQNENDALSRDVAAGAKRVRILSANLATAQLAAGQHATGRDSGTGSVGNDTAVELTAEAGQSVLDIRRGIISDHAKIDYLQGYITNVVKQCKR